MEPCKTLPRIQQFEEIARFDDLGLRQSLAESSTRIRSTCGQRKQIFVQADNVRSMPCNRQFDEFFIARVARIGKTNARSGQIVPEISKSAKRQINRPSRQRWKPVRDLWIKKYGSVLREQ